MLRLVSLLVPAIIPSWRFFDEIRPSPRIEFGVCDGPNGMPETWIPLRPRPQRISLSSIVVRLFLNHDWNESLFMVSCAERLIEEDTQHSRDQIFARIQPLLDVGQHRRFRLVFVSRDGAELTRDTLYVSPVVDGCSPV